MTECDEELSSVEVQNMDQNCKGICKPPENDDHRTSSTKRKRSTQNEEHGEKLIVQDGFSWWTNLMLGINSNTERIITKKIEAKK